MPGGTSMDAALFHGNLVTTSRIIYTPSDFAKTNLIHLQEIGELKARKPHVSRRENLSSFLFFTIVEGSGTLEYDETVYSLSQGDCVFLDCRKPYSHRCSDDLWTLKWAHFYGPNMNGIYKKYAARGGRPCFHPDRPEDFSKTLTELYEIADSASYIRDMKIFEKLTSLLTLLMEESWNDQKRRSGSRKLNLQDVKDYLDQHYQDKITLEGLADLFYINKFYLTRIFKEQFGLSVNNYLQMQRITHAKQLLRFTELPIEKIGQECGMADANYFSRVFKKVEGMTPGEFRRMW